MGKLYEARIPPSLGGGKVRMMELTGAEQADVQARVARSFLAAGVSAIDTAKLGPAREVALQLASLKEWQNEKVPDGSLGEEWYRSLTPKAQQLCEMVHNRLHELTTLERKFVIDSCQRLEGREGEYSFKIPGTVSAEHYGFDCTMLSFGDVEDEVDAATEDLKKDGEGLHKDLAAFGQAASHRLIGRFLIGWRKRPADPGAAEPAAAREAWGKFVPALPARVISCIDLAYRRMHELSEEEVAYFSQTLVPVEEGTATETTPESAAGTKPESTTPA